VESSHETHTQVIRFAQQRALSLRDRVCRGTSVAPAVGSDGGASFELADTLFESVQEF
jgi:hypothetical protein